ncbi:MAG: dUTP diphosphatase [Oligosphaeraceae bacterium]|jgi:dUTP pyrophosphatase|nr:dUTP diphosphatase [Oligosphaeraceae bacterium]
MTIRVKFKMAPGCEDLRPHKQHLGDSGFDLHSRTDAVLPAGGFLAVPTGLFLELPLNYEGQVRPRSGLAARLGVTVLNTPGTIDSAYRGEVQVILINHGRGEYQIKRGDRIAQLVLQSLPEIDFVAAELLSETERGSAGFGSTGR